MDELRNSFRNPPVSHRAAPLWVWNDLMSEEQIAFQLKELKNHGFGGAFVHPRPGLITDYLSEEWFDRWGFALKIAKELGLKLYIYDENSYPSGFAGGHVSSQLPDCLAEGMTYQIIDLSKDVPDGNVSMCFPANTPIAAFSCKTDGDKIEILDDISVYPDSEWAEHAEKVFVVLRVKSDTTGWLAGFAFTDLLRPEVHQAFMETTYEQYYRRFGEDFGDAVPAIFTDEPNISAGSVYGSGAPALPFSFWFLDQFEKYNGYSLTKNLPCVFKNLSGEIFDYPAEKIRYDYYKTIHYLWVKNSIAPTGEWCEKHNINFTGHYLEHQWPHVGSATSPSMQSFYEYHQWPAIDMLLSNYLRDTEFHSLALSIQEIRSASNQFGKKRTLCELYGAGGWDSTFDDYKRMADWVMVNGINFINQHLTYATIAGARKRDHPQSFDWREPWWDQYTTMNDYIGRVCTLLSRGKMEQRILLLNPSTTGYLTPYEEEKGGIYGDPNLDAIKNPDMTAFLTLSQTLTDHQWDYDFGDEYTMERHGSVDGRQLKVGKQAYDVVLISGDMKNLRTVTVDLLKKAEASGVKLLAVGKPGPYVEGLKDEAAYADLAKGWEEIALENVDARLEALIGRRMSANVPFLRGMTHMRRVLDDGREVYFIVNHSFSDFDGVVTVPGDKACEYMLYTGEVQGVHYTARDGKVSFPLKLTHCQSAMIMVGEAADVADAAAADTAVALKLTAIESEQPNQLPIGYCDVHMDHMELKDVSVIRGGDRIFTQRGFQNNPWDNKVQYKNNLMNKNPNYGPGSGFSADYHFFLEKGFRPTKMDVTAEQYTLCRVEINGVAVPWLENEHYLDEHFGVADITAYLKDGENVVTVVADTFDVRLELESVYLRGDFDVRSVDNRWVIGPETKLGYGSWKEQGKPFYPYAVNYRYTAHLDATPAAATLFVGNYGATAVSAIVNGTEVLLNVDGHLPQDVASLLKAGDNEITLRVCGSLKNLMGPHFGSETTRGSAWPGMWKWAPTHQPGADAYDLMDFGLNEAPVLKIGK
ncbi:MAG: glycosyl hydrolase [Eubacteriales bacterium]|nr:glycosyl hydrolase [Eubacteriales bacterium]